MGENISSQHYAHSIYIYYEGAELSPTDERQWKHRSLRVCFTFSEKTKNVNSLAKSNKVSYRTVFFSLLFLFFSLKEKLRPLMSYNLNEPN